MLVTEPGTGLPAQGYPLVILNFSFFDWTKGKMKYKAKSADGQKTYTLTMDVSLLEDGEGKQL